MSTPAVAPKQILPWLLVVFLALTAAWAGVRCYLLSAENARLAQQLRLSEVSAKSAEVQLESERLISQGMAAEAAKKTPEP